MWCACGTEAYLCGQKTETADCMIPSNDILEREHETDKNRSEAVMLKGGEGNDYKWV